MVADLSIWGQSVLNRTVRRLVLPIIATAALAAGAVAVAGTAFSVPAASTPGWRITDKLPSGVKVTSIVATSRTNAWAVGSNRGGGILVWHWTGARWLPLSMPPGLAQHAQSSTIAASPDGSAWVFGIAGGVSNAQSFVLHWTGHRWAATDSGPWDADYTTTAVAPDAHDVWSFGWDDATPPVNAHFNGGSWSAVQLPIYVQQASALSASDIWAVGDDGSPQTSAVLHWNGTSWNTVKLPALHLPPGDSLGELNQVSAVAPDNIWVAADLQSGKIGNLYSAVLLLYWNVSTWQQVTVPHGLISGQLYGVDMSQDGRGGLWLTTVPLRGKEVVLHYTGGQWQRAAAPGGLSSVAWIPGTTSVWATASDGIAKYGP
jgi:hypothetical protein